MASIFSEAEWVAMFEAGFMPEVFVNVCNLRAGIMLRKPGTGEYIDITSEIENGRELAEKAVEEAGGWLSMSGWYPPSDKIMKAIKKKTRQANRKG